MRSSILPRGAVLAGFALLGLGPVAHAQHELEEIQVVGTPRSASPADLAQSVTVIQDEDLRRAQSSSLGETLAGQLGVTASSFGAGASRPVIRGLAGARVRTMDDGIDSLDIATVSADHAVSIDPLIAEQIEIFRGPTTLLYGSGAVGGVVNTITRRIPEAAPESGLEGALELRGDTAAADRTAAARLDSGTARFAWHVDALSRTTGDYDIPGSADLGAGAGDSAAGKLANSDVDTDSAALGGSWLGENGYLGVALSRFETQYGVPAHEEAGEPAERVRIDLEQSRADLKGSWLGVTERLQAVNVRFGSSEYRHVELEGGEIGTVFSNDAYEGRLELLHAPIGHWDGAVGLQFGHREFSALGPEAFVPAVDTSSLGVFVLEQRDFGPWNLALGGRLERLEHEPGVGFAARQNTASSFSAAAIRDLGGDFTLALNLQQAQRTPVAEELYAQGPHLASNSFELGNAQLREEISRHTDIALRKTAGSATWGLTLFYTSFDRFIYLRDLGTEDEASGLPVFVFDQDDADIYGAEAELFMTLAQTGSGEFDLRLYTDYVKGQLASGVNLPRMPPWRFGARLQYHTDSFLAGIEASRYDSQTKTAPLETSTPAYTMLNADLRYALPDRGMLRMSVFFKANNLLDEDARRHSSMVKDIAPLPGRNFAVALRAEF